MPMRSKLSFFLLVISITVRSQGDIRLHFRHVTMAAGLSGIYVRKIVQDPYGFMWIGTEDGLNRYDGRHFTIYNKGLGGHHSLTGTDIRDLLLDIRDHLVWVISSFGGIDAIDYQTGNSLFTYSEDKDRKLEGVVFNSLALVGNELLIGSTNGLYVLDVTNKVIRKAEICSPGPDKGTNFNIDNLAADRAGRLWLFCRDIGVLVLDERTLALDGMLDQRQLGIEKGKGFRGFDCTVLQDGSMMVGTSVGVRIVYWEGDKPVVRIDPFPALPPLGDKNIYACRQDRTGAIWICTTNHLIRVKAGGGYDLVKEHTSYDDLNWLDAVYAIYFDQDNDLWLGCQAGLAYSQSEPSWFLSISRSAISPEKIQHAYYIGTVNDSTLFCCAQEGLYEVHPLSGVISALAAGKPYYHAFVDPFGRVMVSNIDGVYILSGRKLIPAMQIYPEFRSLPMIFVNSHCYSGDSVIVFGTENDRGVLIWNVKEHTARLVDTQSTGLWLKENTVNGVYRDEKGDVWVLGDRSATILDLKSKRSRSLQPYDLTGRTSFSLFFDVVEADGKYYMTSYGEGVVVMDSNYHFIRRLSVKDGLSANTVYKILPYKDSVLFVTSNNGISAVDIKNGYRIKNYFESDGLHSNNFEENSGARRNDRLYAGGLNGLTVLIPSLYVPHLLPPLLYLREIRSETLSGQEDTSNILLNGLEIPNNVLQTTVYFSPIQYANPDRVHLSYRVKELKGGWIDLGGQDYVTFLGQPPGLYTLEVRAFNEDGVGNAHPLELSLTFLPKWYQTIWFRALVVVLVLGLTFSFFLYRIRQLKKRQQIRKDIASDLHDDIGSTLNTVKIFTHLARRDQQREDYLGRIEASLAEATAGLRDMIWVLDDTRDTVRALSERIKNFGSPISQANGIRFSCSVEEGIIDLVVSKTVKRNLLMIAKETINNSIKYANCETIELLIQKKGSKLALSIRDNGKGFDAEGQFEGNGLKNIRERARQIKYSAFIRSSPGAGTVVEIIGN